MRFRRRAVELIAVSAILGASSLAPLAAAASAAPAPGRVLVTMGDSFTATAPIATSPTAGCVRPTTSWPSRLAAAARITDVADESCNGGAIDTGPGYTLADQARHAARIGAFGARTRAVLIQAGLNDRWGASRGRAFPSVDCLLDVVRGCGQDAIAQGRVPDSRAVTPQAYARRIRVIVDYVKYYAPRAQIVLVGYPVIFASGQQAACMDILGAHLVQPRAQAYIAFLDSVDAAQRGAAAILGIGFFDSRAVTAGHGSCSPRSWIGGVTRPDVLVVGAPIHPTPFGNVVLARALKSRLGL